MKRNPFQTERSLIHSNYCLSVERDLKYSPRDPEMGQFALEVFEQLQAMIVDEGYVCTGAQAAFRQESYRMGAYAEMGSMDATAGLAHDLFTFLEDRKRIDSDFATFVAVFQQPTDLQEEAFEALLWKQLQQLHELDAEHHAWDQQVMADPDHPQFSYSFAGTACFVIGLHANSSRPSRRFPYPALVFNAHEQFERLRETGAFERMKETIRSRDLEQHGSINPMLDDFGVRSEARQYAGRAVGEDWKCPFRPRVAVSNS